MSEPVAGIIDLDVIMSGVEPCLQSPECTDSGPSETKT